MGIVNRIITKWLELEPEFCESCETLRAQLEIANYEKKKLLDNLVDMTRPVTSEPVDRKEVEPIRPKALTWRMKQQELEKNDRMTAEKLAEVKRMNEELEKELNLTTEEGQANAG